jgi:hypothetical protein
MGRPEALQPAPAAKVPEEALSSNASAARAPSIAVSSDGGISANVQNRPLGEVLRLMAEKHLFEIQGPLPRTALVTMQFSGLTLQQAFNRMMRGYNYAVITEDVSDKRVLMVLSEAKRIEYRELFGPAQTPGQAEETPQQSGAAPVAAAAQAAGEVPEGTTTVPLRRAAILQQRGRLNVEGLPAPPGPVQGAETPQAPAQEQKGQEQQGLAGPGAAAMPPNTEGGSPVQDWRPSDRSTLGSF